MPGASGGFVSASKLLDKKWKDRQYRAHREKMKSMKAGLPTESPKQYPHLSLRLKTVQRGEARQAEIDHENQLLLEKMTYIMKSKGTLDNWNEYHTRSLNHTHRDREQERIAAENLEIAKRLENIKPKYDVKDWEDEYKHHAYLQDMWASTTKDYDLSPCARGQSQENEEEDMDEEDRDSNSSTKLPKIEQQESNKKSDSGKKDPTVTKLPQLKSQKDAIADQDAKLLFRACKGLGNPEDAVLRTLIRRSPSQRMTTAKKFEDLYDLNLGPELKSAMGSGFHVLIDCLLSDKDEADIKAIQTAIHNNSATILVEMFSTRNSSVLLSLQKSYKKKYGSTLKEDIAARILDEECQLLLFALLKDGRPDDDTVDRDLATQQAEELYEGGPDRYTDADGMFMQILESSSLAQIKAVFVEYRTMCGKTIIDTMKEDGCSKDFVAAVKTMDGTLVTSATYWAQQIHGKLKPSNPDLIKLLLARNEAQMPAIRAAYKKKYRSDLLEDILNKCGKQEATLVAQIAARGVPASKQKANKKGESGQPQAKKSPVRRPEPKKEADTFKDSPLAKKQSDKKKSSAQKSTVKASKDFNVDDDVTNIHDAIQGWGTDEQPLIDILTSRSNAQRQQIKKKYKEKYDKDLKEELESELSGDFEEVILALLMTPTEYDVHCLHDAVDGLGTAEGVLIGIMTTRNAKEMKAINSLYQKEHGETLSDALEGDTSGDFNALLQQLIKAERPQDDKVDKTLAKADAKKLHRDGQNAIDLKTNTFQEVMTKRNKAQVQATFEEYEKISGQTIEDSIRNAMVGDSEDAYLALAKALVDPVEFYAFGLRESMDGVGTNDNMLIRIVVSRSETDLGSVKAKFKELSGKTLEENIDNECSGDYKKVLLALVKDKPNEEDDTKETPGKEKPGNVEKARPAQRNVKRKEDGSTAGQPMTAQKNIKRTEDGSRAGQPRPVQKNAKKQEVAAKSGQPPRGNNPTKHSASEKTKFEDTYRWWDTFGNKQGNYYMYKRPQSDPRPRRKMASADDAGKKHHSLKKHSQDDDTQKNRSRSVGDRPSPRRVNRGSQTDPLSPLLFETDRSNEKHGWKIPPGENLSEPEEDRSEKSKSSSPRAESSTDDVFAADEDKIGKDKYKHEENEDQDKNVKKDDADDFWDDNGDAAAPGNDTEKNKEEEKTSSKKGATKDKNKDLPKTTAPEKKSKFSSMFNFFGGSDQGENKDSEKKMPKNESSKDKGNLPKKGTKKKNEEANSKGKKEEVKRNDSKQTASMEKEESDIQDTTEGKSDAGQKLKENEETGKDDKKAREKKAKEEYYKSNKNYTYIPPRKIGGTIKEDPNDDPQEDIRTLWKAMEGSGTNESALIDLLTARTNKQRQIIRKRYKETYNQDLLHALRIDLRGSFRDAILALLMAPDEYDAYCLHEALNKLGNEQAAVNIVAGTRSAEQLEVIRNTYQDIYDQDVASDVESGPHRDYCTLLAAMLTAEREDTNYVDMSLVKEDAKKLANNGNPKLRPNDKPYVDVMIKRSFPHIRAVFKEYENLTGNHLIDDANKVIEGDTDAEEAILSLAWSVEDPVAYLAHRLCGAVDDFGADEGTMIKIIVSRSEVDLVQIRENFQAQYEQSIAEWLRKVCRGSTQDLLIALVEGARAK